MKQMPHCHKCVIWLPAVFQIHFLFFPDIFLDSLIWFKLNWTNVIKERVKIALIDIAKPLPISLNWNRHIALGWSSLLNKYDMLKMDPIVTSKKGTVCLVCSWSFLHRACFSFKYSPRKCNVLQIENVKHDKWTDRAMALHVIVFAFLKSSIDESLSNWL